MVITYDVYVCMYVCVGGGKGDSVVCVCVCGSYYYSNIARLRMKGIDRLSSSILPAVPEDLSRHLALGTSVSLA